MAYHRFRVNGKVRGQSRPRHTRNGHTYKPHSDRVYEEEIKKAYINSGGINFADKPIYVSITIHRALPKSAPKKIKEQDDTMRPDIDNVIKICLDALNGIAYEDDSQVVQVSAFKCPRKRCVEHMEIVVGIQEEL